MLLTYVDYCTAIGVIKKLCFWGSSCFNIQQAHSLIITIYRKILILFELEVLMGRLDKTCQLGIIYCKIIQVLENPYTRSLNLTEATNDGGN